MPIELLYSRHLLEKVTRGEVFPDLVRNCVFTGERELQQEPNKYRARKRFRRGTFVTVYLDRGEHYFVITAYWQDQ